MKNTKSNKLFEYAKKVIPGGVNSPVRAFKSVGTTPRFIARAKGAYLWDADDNRYIDYIGSWGPMILGHSHPSIIKAIREKAKHGTSFGAPTELEVKIAELITKMVPSIEMLRMVNSGTEATMSAIRLARAFTRKDKIIKFDGCYHGHADSFLIKAGSGAATFGTPDSPGVTKSTAADTLNATFNDIDSVNKIINDHKFEIAAIIVEPIVGNMGCIPPKPGFLEALRVLCTKQNIILIFDEVMTGFRVSPGGAQELYKIKPDLTTLGKIIGGGLPVGAYGGKREIMEMVAPNGPMYQAGTLSGNPLAMAAGFEMLSILSNNKSIYKKLERSSRQIEEGFKENLKKLNLNFVINRVGSMFTLFFTNNEVTDADSARRSDTNLFGIYFRAMLENGIYLPPSQYETAFVSTEHTRYLIDKTIRANFKSLKAVLDSMK
jgi:glutamate-1-semialdehyde 2,1-aminomutase